MPASGVTAVVVNVTATGGTARSFVTVYPDGSGRPGSSSVNFTAGETIANLVMVPVGADGKVDFYNSAGSVNLVADLSGYYTGQGPSWGDAIEVPGTAALNTGSAQVMSLPCPSAGNCAAVGTYSTGADTGQAFVVSEVDGSWGDAIQVPCAQRLQWRPGLLGVVLVGRQLRRRRRLQRDQLRWQSGVCRQPELSAHRVPPAESLVLADGPPGADPVRRRRNQARPVWLKPEPLQPTGAFKPRGTGCCSRPGECHPVPGGNARSCWMAGQSAG